MTTLTILEHPSAKYGPRTRRNAAVADVTAAFAADYRTAGEVLTKKAAGLKYVAISLLGQHGADQFVRFVHPRLGDRPCVVNIAGNGINTFYKYGWDQIKINTEIHRILKLTHWPIRQIICGGQTGADIAGAVAGVALGIPVEIMMPKGFRQRNAAGIDIYTSEQFVRQQVMGYVDALV